MLFNAVGLLLATTSFSLKIHTYDIIQGSDAIGNAIAPKFPFLNQEYESALMVVFRFFNKVFCIWARN